MSLATAYAATGTSALRHAEIVQEGSAYWLVDLGSTNGTEVNGRRVQRARLDDGSRFTLGETTVTFSTERE